MSALAIEALWNQMDKDESSKTHVGLKEFVLRFVADPKAQVGRERLLVGAERTARLQSNGAAASQFIASDCLDIHVCVRISRML